MNTSSISFYSKWRNGEGFLLSVIILALFYPWYRYPFQISSTETSPGYSDTPTYLQAGKFLLFGLLVFFKLGISTFRLNVDKKIPLVNVVLSLTALYLGLAPMLYVDSKLAFGHAMSGIFWITVPLILLVQYKQDSEKSPFSISRIKRLLSFFFHFSIIFFLLEVGLFIFAGRLPALSFSDSMLVRFGGLWDDPNGFSVFLAFFVPLAFFDDFAIKRKLFAVVFVGLLVLGTQSGTGVIAVTLAFILTCTICFIFDRPSKAYVHAIVLPFALFLIAITAIMSIDNVRRTLFDIVNLILDLKSGSIEAHSSSIDVAGNLTALTSIGLAPLRDVGESAYVNFLTNYGIQYIVVFFFTSLVFMMGCLRVLRNSDDVEVRVMMQGIICFELAFLLSLINLPLDHVFPVNLLFIALGTIPFMLSNHLRATPPTSAGVSWRH